MLQSLLMKLAMLVATMGLVFWIGLQRSDLAANSPPSGEGSLLAPVRAESESSRTEQGTHEPASAPSRALGGVAVAGSSASRQLLDLNRATQEDLEALPGVGAVLAQRVIEFRQSAGRFETVEDLLAVKGIGSRKFDRIKPLVTVAAAQVQGKLEKRPL